MKIRLGRGINFSSTRQEISYCHSNEMQLENEQMGSDQEGQ